MEEKVFDFNNIIIVAIYLLNNAKFIKANLIPDIFKVLSNKNYTVKVFYILHDQPICFSENLDKP
jgi:hypothetical protein